MAAIGFADVIHQFLVPDGDIGDEDLAALVNCYPGILGSQLWDEIHIGTIWNQGVETETISGLQSAMGFSDVVMQFIYPVVSELSINNMATICDCHGGISYVDGVIDWNLNGNVYNTHWNVDKGSWA